MRRLLILLPLLLPTYLIRFPVFSIPCTLLEVYILGLFGYWLVCERHKRLTHAFVSPLILFLLAGTLSVLVSPDLRAALGLYKAYVLEPVMVYYLVIQYLTVQDIRKLFVSFAYLMGILSAVLLLQLWGWIPSPDPWIHEIPPRYSAFFPYPNAVGLLSAPLTVLFCVLGWWVPALCGFFAIIASQSHGALLAVCGTLLGLLLIRRKYLLSLLFSVMTVIFFLALSSMHSFPLWGDNASAVRIALWQGSGRVLLANPWLGTGLAGFPVWYPLFKEASHTEIPLYAHNLVLDVWLQLGFLGIVAFSWLLFRFFATKAPRLQAMMLCLLLYGLVDVPYFKNDLAILFWLILALSEVTQRELSTPKP